jgi:hypothetical protein
MREVSKKFPAVMTTQEVLGIEEGTVLRFDWSSGKYVSIEEVEDVADDYYYSGYAIAIDPYLVKDNIGTYFVHVEQGEVEEPVEWETKTATSLDNVEVQKTQVYSDEDAKNQLKTEEELAKEPTMEEPKESNVLVVDCDCGARHISHTVDSPGINITLMAHNADSFLELSCGECGACMKLWFASDDEKTSKNEPTPKENR